MSEAVKIIIKALRSYLQLKQFRFNKENVLLNLNAPLAPQHFMLIADDGKNFFTAVVVIS